MNAFNAATAVVVARRVRTALGRSQQRFRRARPGSILILVVGLLVLMALIGTAWISTVRSDVYTSGQNAANTQIDLLVEGVKQMATGVAVGDLFEGNAFRPVIGATTYDDWDWPYIAPVAGPVDPKNDMWLASRLPVLHRPLKAVAMSSVPPRFGDTTFTMPLADNPPRWESITNPLVGGQFESPWRAPGNTNGGLTYSQNQRLYPWYTSMNAATISAVTVSGEVRPGFIVNVAPVGSPANFQPVLAADADGDGEADSGLFRLPVGEINGVTYYAAVRIVDNNSALNLNTAWSSSFDFVGNNSTTPVAGLSKGAYPTGISLLETLRTYNTAMTVGSAMINAGTQNGTTTPAGGEHLKLVGFRFNNASAPAAALANTGTANQPVIVDPSDPVVTSGKNPDPTMLARDDFMFGSLSDAFWWQVGSRLDNIGRWGQSPPNRTNTFSYHAGSVSELAALAHKFCLADPDASPTEMESALQETLLGTSAAGPGYKLVATKPYSPDAPQTWFSENFDFYNDVVPGTSTVIAGRAPSLWMPKRAVSVMTNAVSTVMRPKVYPVTPATTPPSLPQPVIATAVVEPKVSANTASFPELWRAYWMVMSEDSGTTSFGTTPYHAVATTNPTEAPINHYKMFRSPIRNIFNAQGTAPVEMTEQDTVALRAAISAVNTIDLRDSDNDVTTETVQLPSGRTVTVYGTEPQPFITEVFADNFSDPQGNPGPTGPPPSNPRGYVAVELYNPYPYDLVLANWRLGMLDRNSTASYTTGLNVLPITRHPTLPPVLSEGSTGRIRIPAHGYAVLENYQPNATARTPDDAINRPFEAATLTATIAADPTHVVAYYTPNLHEVLTGTGSAGGEMVLMRPRHYDGTPTLAGNDGAPFAEPNPAAAGNPANLNDLVPVDAVDFSGAYQSAPGENNWMWCHWSRPSGNLSNWKFVYEGDYNTASVEQRHEGWQQSTYLNFKLRTPKPVNVTLGLGTDISPYQNPFPGIQIQNAGFGGPNQIATYEPAREYRQGEVVAYDNSATGNSRHRYRCIAAGGAAPGVLPTSGGTWQDIGPYVPPFGGFLRDGDIFQVPFVGDYRIREAGVPLAGAAFVEMNTLPMDCTYARYTAGTTSPSPTTQPTAPETNEYLGRFCGQTDTTNGTWYDDLNNVGTYGAATGGQVYWRYHWANRLLDYVTAQTPADAYFPNIDPAKYAAGLADPRRTPQPLSTGGLKATAYSFAVAGGSVTSVRGRTNLSNNANYYAGLKILFTSGTAVGQSSTVTAYDASTQTLTFNPAVAVAPAAGDGFKILGEQGATPTEGLININTAPWWVLARLPLVLYSEPGGANAAPAGHAAGEVDQELTNRLARLIVLWRDGDASLAGTPFQNPHGPFRSILDLNRVKQDSTYNDPADPFYNSGNLKGFQNAFGTITSTQDPGVAQRDLSPSLQYPPPGGAAPDVPVPEGVRNDFEEKFLALNRISNMITTRSDSFACYVLVQGWRNVGTGNPELVVQRRAAFLLDRSQVDSAGGVTPRTINISAN